VRQVESWGDGTIPAERIHQSAIRPAGAIPVAHHVLVETPAAHTRTVIEIREAEFDQSLEDDFFTQRHLERGAR
jgi:Outer membrane lipoprotein-sorting protein